MRQTCHTTCHYHCDRRKNCLEHSPKTIEESRHLFSHPRHIQSSQTANGTILFAEEPLSSTKCFRRWSLWEPIPNESSMLKRSSSVSDPLHLFKKSQIIQRRIQHETEHTILLPSSSHIECEHVAYISSDSQMPYATIESSL